MIIIKLIGGLGNQMFQYATGRRAAYINKTELKLDTSWFNNPEGAIKRDYLLNVFNIKEIFASKQEIDKLKGKNKNLLVLFNKKFSKITKPYYKQSCVVQRFFHFNKNILKVSNNIYLQGHWVSEKYFKEIEEIIRNEFIFKDKPDKANQKMISRIKNCDSVSIHIRRGDYVTDQKTNQFHGIIDLNYYFRSIEYITSKIKSPHFFIFSDDLQWAKQNLHLKFPCVYVNHNIGKKDYEDMRLMSYCQHNIIANSSFSWWGAWLNKNSDKIVIAPKKWFRDKSINTKDLIPQSWMKI